VDEEAAPVGNENLMRSMGDHVGSSWNETAIGQCGGKTERGSARPWLIDIHRRSENKSQVTVLKLLAFP
jgi:hypothetical protein